MKNKMGKKTIIGLVIAAVAIILVACVIRNATTGTTVSCFGENAKLEVVGHNGHTVLNDKEYDANFEEIEARKDEIEANLFSGKTSSSELKEYNELEDFESSIKYEIECPEGKEITNLENGDVIKVCASYDKELAKKLHIRVENTEWKYTVEGLQDIQEIDLFDGINIEWRSAGAYAVEKVIVDENTWNGKNITYNTEVEDDGVFTLTANIDEETLAVCGFYAKDGLYSKVFKIGTRPEEIKRVDGEDSDKIKELCRQQAEAYAEKYMSDCSELSVNGDTVKIDNYTISDPFTYWFDLHEKIEFHLSNGKKYSVTMFTPVYRLEDGSVVILEDAVEKEEEPNVCKVKGYDLEDE